MNRAFLLIALVICELTSCAQIAPHILTSPWSSFWINLPDENDEEFGVFHFRKTIHLSQRPESFVVHVSADNRYKLFVNDSLVSLGPAASDLYHWNFETIDLAPFLKQGENILAAVVWNFGKKRPEAQISWRTAFILQGNSSREEIANSNRTWKASRNKSYRPVVPELVYTYYVAGPGEQEDKNDWDDSWTNQKFDDSKWKNVQELFNGLPKGAFAWTNGWMLIPRKIPPMELKIQRLRTVKNIEGTSAPEKFPSVKSVVEVKANTKATLLLDQTFLTNAYPVLKFSKGKSATISISYAEALYVKDSTADWRTHRQKGNRNETDGKRFVGVTDKVISNGKTGQIYTTLAWRCFRYVQLTIETKDEPLTLYDIYGISTGYPFLFNAVFQSDQPKLNSILDVGWRTARLCAAETYMDCPYYERLQYIGDTRIQALVSLFNSGDDRLVRNAIEQIDFSRMAEGITLSRYPTANSQQIPTFSLWYIGMLHDYWWYRPDADFVKEKLSGVQSIFHFFEKYERPDGLIANAPYWDFTDWTNSPGWRNGIAPIGADGTSAEIDLLLCLAYKTAAELEENIGSKENAERYKAKFNLLRQSITKAYWDESTNLFSDTSEKKYFSAHANTLAILAEVVDGKNAQTLMRKILSDKTIAPATIYFKYYVHRALAKCGLGDLYLNQLGDWYTQLDVGLTTWAEISDHNNARSDCHAWGSSPNIELFRIVLGIDSDGPGFDKIKIEPHLPHMENASGSIPHPKGKIEVSYQPTIGKAIVTIPQTTTGNFIWKGRTYALHAGKNEFSDLER
jgi:alpha-L-rhamnosidase